jgi:cephalosporin hydroxylase
VRRADAGRSLEAAPPAMKLTEYLVLQYGLLLRLFGKEAREPKQAGVVEQFHKLYYYDGSTGGTWFNTKWFGCRVLKCPLDLWVYQEIICETRPDLIIETGTCEGGSAFYMAIVCEYLNQGEIVSIDIQAKPGRPQHKRIQYWTGSSTAPDIVEKVRQLARGRNVLVILDSDHSAKHVADELAAYSELVPKGGYLIVEDTNLNGHPANPEHGPGPMEAVDEFLRRNPAFQIDAAREKFFMTFNPRGYLKRVA